MCVCAFIGQISCTVACLAGGDANKEEKAGSREPLIVDAPLFQYDAKEYVSAEEITECVKGLPSWTPVPLPSGSAAKQVYCFARGRLRSLEVSLRASDTMQSGKINIIPQLFQVAKADDNKEVPFVQLCAPKGTVHIETLSWMEAIKRYVDASISVWVFMRSVLLDAIRRVYK